MLMNSDCRLLVCCSNVAAQSLLQKADVKQKLEVCLFMHRMFVRRSSNVCFSCLFDGECRLRCLYGSNARDGLASTYSKSKNFE